MRHEVIVKFAGGDELLLHPAAPMALDAARAWLDQEFMRLECDPVRPTGKVLFSDRLLAIAQAAGAEGFADAAWAAQFAGAAAGALGRPLIRVDVDGSSIGY
jgi:hypothetical protein